MSRPLDRVRAPFPWFGGKRRAAALIWRALGDPPNYVEPFFGSGASLLARPPKLPARARTETRVLGPSVTTGIGLTGVLLDPPYLVAAGRDPSIYAEEDGTASERARAWALEHGDDPKLRIVLCGYEGEHEMPASWRVVKWKAAGGYAAAAGNGENAERERLWLSPHCLRFEPEPEQLQLLEASG